MAELEWRVANMKESDRRNVAALADRYARLGFGGSLVGAIRYAVASMGQLPDEDLRILLERAELVRERA